MKTSDSTHCQRVCGHFDAVLGEHANLLSSLLISTRHSLFVNGSSYPTYEETAFRSLRASLFCLKANNTILRSTFSLTIGVMHQNFASESYENDGQRVPSEGLEAITYRSSGP